MFFYGEGRTALYVTDGICKHKGFTEQCVPSTLIETGWYKHM